MSLIVRGAKPESVFHLNGTSENGATFALAWVLEQSPSLRAAVVGHLFKLELDASDVVIFAQKHGEDGGFTDLEMHVGNQIQLIIEAKSGWQVAGLAQLAKYRPRLEHSSAARRLIVSLSSADAQTAKRVLPDRVDGVDVIHMSWSNIQRLAGAASREATGFEEKLWLRHLSTYMKDFAAMDRVNDNTVYVVSLSREPMREDGMRTFVDVVEDERRYFHPIGKTWPVQPPNYMGFRYDGTLQSIRRSLRHCERHLGGQSNLARNRHGLLRLRAWTCDAAASGDSGWQGVSGGAGQLRYRHAA